MMAQISAKDLATDLGLAADKLSKPCDSKIIPSLADCFSQWRVVFASLLSEIDLGDINRENHTEEEKRIAALHKWKARKGDGATYEVVVSALLNIGEKGQAESLCKILSDSLSDKYLESTTTDYDAEAESESVIKFECPCSECSLEAYLQNGCPKSCVPYLGMTTLSKSDQENLNYILKKDTKKIMKSFTDLSNRTCDSLVRQEVTVEKLVRVAANFNTSLRDQLMRSKSIDEVFTDLAPEMSFFNHDILANIIEELGDKDDKNRLINYSEEFKEFCKRKVFEIEPGHCTCGHSLSKLKGRKLFAVVLPTSEMMMKKLGDAVNIKETLADVLGVPPATLHLHRIDRGSVILVFSVPDCIAKQVFPLLKEKVSLLRVKGILLFVPQELKTEVKGMEVFLGVTDHDSHIDELSSKPHVKKVPSGTPGGLKISHSRPTSAQLSWTPVPEDKWNGIITGYTIEIVGPDFTRTVQVKDATTTSAEVSCLQPFTSYYFSVSAMTVDGTGPAARIFSITPQAVPSATPGELHISHSHPTTAQLSWTPVPEDKQNDVITGYTIEIAEGCRMYIQRHTRQIPVMDANATSYEVSDLKPYTTYTFSVSATTKAGTGPAISVSSTTLQGAPYGTPKWLTVNCSGPTSAWLYWAVVPKDLQNGHIISYTIQVVGPDYSIRSIHATSTFNEVSDLSPSTQYTFNVSAMTVAGSGPAISVTFIMPQTALSNTVGRLTTSQYQPISAQISWLWRTEQEDWQDKIVTGYIVEVEGPDSTQQIPINEYTTSVEMFNLWPSTQYTFKVSAMTITGIRRGPKSSSIPPRALQYSHIPRLPGNFLKSGSICSYYSWKSAASGKNTAQYRMMLKCTPSLTNVLANGTNIIRLARELEKVGLISMDNKDSLTNTAIDADIRAAELVSMVITKVDHNSENFTTFLGVLKKDQATYEHILIKMEEETLEDPFRASGPLRSSDPLSSTALFSDSFLHGLVHGSHEFQELDAGLEQLSLNTVTNDDISLSRPLLPPIEGHIKYRHLYMIKWRNENDEVQRFYLMEKIAYEWRTIGELLGLTFSRLQSLADEHGSQPEDCCQAVLDYWFNNPHNHRRSAKYPTTWKGLIGLLEDSKLGQVAAELRTILNKVIDL